MQGSLMQILLLFPKCLSDNEMKLISIGFYRILFC